MRKLLAITLFFQTACSVSNNGDEQFATAQQPPVLDLLEAGDGSVCVHADVFQVLNEKMLPFETAHRDYGVSKEEYDDAIRLTAPLENISASDINRNIREVTCEGTGFHGLTVEYKIRPSADKTGFIIKYPELISYPFAPDSLLDKLRSFHPSPSPATDQASLPVGGEADGIPSPDSQGLSSTATNGAPSSTPSEEIKESKNEGNYTNYSYPDRDVARDASATASDSAKRM